MSMKRLALIAAVSSHHTSHITTKIITTQTLAVSAPSTTTTASTGRTITDDGNLNLNATGIGQTGRAVGGGGGGAGVTGFSPVWQSSGGVWGGSSSGSSSGRSENVSTSVSYSGGTSGNNYFTQDVSKGSELYQGHQAMRPGATLHGNVNVLLGGAMLSVVITVVCVVCYCCHRNIKKRSDSMYRQQRWIDNTTAGMEIYSVEQCYEASRLYGDSTETTSMPLHLPASHSGPPPSYDSVLAMDEFIGRPSPPPKYHQHPRQPCRTCCTMARQASVARSTCTLTNCRKHSHSHHHHRHQRSPSLPDRASRPRITCACLNLNEQAQLGQPSEPDPKLVPTANESQENKIHVDPNANPQPLRLESLQPEREYHTCQLCGKLQRTSAAISQMRNANLTPAGADDIANGNVEEITLCSCDTFEFVLNYDNAADELIHSEDTEDAPKIEIDRMSNETNNGSHCRDKTSSEVQSTQFELDSNFNQANPRRQQSHHHNENNNHQQQFSPPESERRTTNHQQHHQNHQQQTHNLAAFDTFTENGIIRMDMSQIIDRTGLPTYEAAIKLESSGYV